MLAALERAHHARRTEPGSPIGAANRVETARLRVTAFALIGRGTDDRAAYGPMMFGHLLDDHHDPIAHAIAGAHEGHGKLFRQRALLFSRTTGRHRDANDWHSQALLFVLNLAAFVRAQRIKSLIA